MTDLDRMTKLELLNGYRKELEDNVALRARVEKLEAELSQFKKYEEFTDKFLKFYTNADTPPSKESLEWKKEKREKKKRAKSEDQKPGKLGGVKGHVGTSRKRSPEKTIRHNFNRKKDGKKRIIDVKCDCGCDMVLGKPQVRDILDIEIIPSEIRHRIETATCTSCGSTKNAPNDLPARGNLGKTLAGMVLELRASRIPLKMITVAVASMTGIDLATSTICNAITRMADASEAESEEIHKKVEESDVAGFDESHWNDSGKSAYVNVAQSGNNITVNISHSRATLLLDKLDKFDGVAVTDAYRGYNRFDKDGKHQTCWAHDIRQTKHLAEKYDTVPPEIKRVRKQLYDDHKLIYHMAKDLDKCGAHSPRTRYAMNCTIQDMLDKYRHIDDVDMQKVLDKLERHVSCMFTFLEYPGVDPTNNASERALRPIIVLRKIVGQTKGGAESMKKMAILWTNILTWRTQGKSVFEMSQKLL